MKKLVKKYQQGGPFLFQNEQIYPKQTKYTPSPIISDNFIYNAGMLPEIKITEESPTKGMNDYQKAHYAETKRMKERVAKRPDQNWVPETMLTFGSAPLLVMGVPTTVPKAIQTGLGIAGGIGGAEATNAVVRGTSDYDTFGQLAAQNNPNYADFMEFMNPGGYVGGGIGTALEKPLTRKVIAPATMAQQMKKNTTKATKNGGIEVRDNYFNNRGSYFRIVDPLETRSMEITGKTGSLTESPLKNIVMDNFYNSPSQVQLRLKNAEKIKKGEDIGTNFLAAISAPGNHNHGKWAANAVQPFTLPSSLPDGKLILEGSGIGKQFKVGHGGKYTDYLDFDYIIDHPKVNKRRPYSSNRISLAREYDNPINSEELKLFNKVGENRWKYQGNIVPEKRTTLVPQKTTPFSTVTYRPQLNNLSSVFQPGKIVYGHPGIGKTYALDNGKGNFIDWDTLYNKKRDEWIANASKTKVGTPEFKKARNEYLINPEKHSDYIEFLTENWNSAKNIAKQQGKPLLASPHTLLKLFPNDFDAIINLNKKDFIQRNIGRGGKEKESALWKQGIDETLSKHNNIPTYNMKEGEYLSDALNTIINLPKGLL